MKAKTVLDTLNEWGGAGMTYSGGSTIFPVNRGGQMNRGGFGGASNLGGPNMMYTYEIKPLNRVLQPPPTEHPEIEILHVGDAACGQELNKKDGKQHVGVVLKIELSIDGALKYYIILDDHTKTTIKLDPTSTTLVSKLDVFAPLDPALSKDTPELIRIGQRHDKKAMNELMRAKFINEIEQRKDPLDVIGVGNIAYDGLIGEFKKSIIDIDIDNTYELNDAFPDKTKNLNLKYLTNKSILIFKGMVTTESSTWYTPEGIYYVTVNLETGNIEYEASVKCNWSDIGFNDSDEEEDYDLPKDKGFDVEIKKTANFRKIDLNSNFTFGFILNILSEFKYDIMDYLSDEVDNEISKYLNL